MLIFNTKERPEYTLNEIDQKFLDNAIEKRRGRTYKGGADIISKNMDFWIFNPVRLGCKIALLAKREPKTAIVTGFYRTDEVYKIIEIYIGTVFSSREIIAENRELFKLEFLSLANVFFNLKETED